MLDDRDFNIVESQPPTFRESPTGRRRRRRRKRELNIGRALLPIEVCLHLFSLVFAFLLMYSIRLMCYSFQMPHPMIPPRNVPFLPRCAFGCGLSPVVTLRNSLGGRIADSDIAGAHFIGPEFTDAFSIFRLLQREVPVRIWWIQINSLSSRFLFLMLFFKLLLLFLHRPQVIELDSALFGMDIQLLDARVSLQFDHNGELNG